MFLFSSCNKEESIEQAVSTLAEIRTANSLSFAITLTNLSIVYVDGTSFTATHTSGSQFSITVNHSSNSPQTYTAISATITDSDERMELTSNPGFSEVIYEHKASVTIAADSTNKLNLYINPGNINTTATSFVGEEEDGI